MPSNIIYLTIDDGPSLEMKKKLDFLLNKKIPAIWFCEGNKMLKNKEPVKYAIKNGFVIGNHSWTHPSFKELSLLECIDQIKKSDQIIDDLYSQVRVNRQAKLFRFPYGDKGKISKTNFGSLYYEIQNYLRKCGFKQPQFMKLDDKHKSLIKEIDVSWTLDVCEWALPKLYPGKINENFFKIIDRINNHFDKLKSGILDTGYNEIILMHDEEQTTDKFFQIIDYFLSKNITFSLPDF